MFLSCEILGKYMVLFPKGNRLETCLGIRSRSVGCHPNFALVTIWNSALSLKKRAEASPTRWGGKKHYVLPSNSMISQFLTPHSSSPVSFGHAEITVPSFVPSRSEGPRTAWMALGWWLGLSYWAVLSVKLPAVLQGWSSSEDLWGWVSESSKPEGGLFKL